VGDGGSNSSPAIGLWAFLFLPQLLRGSMKEVEHLAAGSPPAVVLWLRHKHTDDASLLIEKEVGGPRGVRRWRWLRAGGDLLPVPRKNCELGVGGEEPLQPQRAPGQRLKLPAHPAGGRDIRACSQAEARKNGCLG